MIRQAIHIIFLSACILLHAMSVCAAPALPEDSTPALADSVIQVEDIQVTAIKQGLNLRNQPVTASVIGRLFHQLHVLPPQSPYHSHRYR